MDLDESILHNQYILDDMEKEPIKYIYCIVLDNSRFLFTCDIFYNTKTEYDFLLSIQKKIPNRIKENYSLVKINSNYFDPTTFEKSYKYFEKI